MDQENAIEILNGSTSVSGKTQLPRKQREKVRHRQDVLDIAENLLTKKSYREISMHEIAAEAEFSVGYLYTLFPNKESIFISLLRYKHESLMAVIDDSLNESCSFENRLTKVVYAIFSWLNENMAYATSSLRDLHALAHTHAGLTSDWLRYQVVMRKRFEGFFQEAVRAGSLIEEKPRLISKTFRALIWGFIREGLLYEKEEENWTENAPIVIHVILRTFSPEKDR